MEGATPMGALARFERRLGGAVEGSVSRVFRSRVEPVELAVALKKEADNNRAVGPAHTLVPNQYEVDLGPSDYERLAPYRLTLGDELAEMVREHASEQQYTFVGPVEVALVRSEDLRTGSYRIGSRVEADDVRPDPALRTTPAPTFAATPPPMASVAPAPVPVAVPLPSVPMAVPLPPGPPAEPVTMPDVGMTTALPRIEEPQTLGTLELPDGQRVTLTGEPVVVGRGHEADVRLADASVSRRHAEFRLSGEKVLVEDLGSTNGTSVNGERIARASLVDGDRITLGAACIVFRT
jgi:hypothetical protein